MGGCNRCDGGSIRHTAGHGDTRSEKCPWCRIAELEAEVTRWRDRHADAMAKLARVAEWAERKHTVENDTAKMTDGVIRNIEEISNILSDMPKEAE